LIPAELSLITYPGRGKNFIRQLFRPGGVLFFIKKENGKQPKLPSVFQTKKIILLKTRKRWNARNGRVSVTA
jgi:hypothetical protein